MYGLTNEQVEERIKNNKINKKEEIKTKSIKKILSEKILTLFNMLNLFLGIAVFLVGSYKNMFFLGVVIINTAISAIQEIHACQLQIGCQSNHIETLNKQLRNSDEFA